MAFDEAAYCYVLGLYLGDGHVVVRSPRSASLFLSLDRGHPHIVVEAAAAAERVFPRASITRYRRPGYELVVIRVTTPDVPHAFPQHGPGKKHTRPIRLEQWQSELTGRHPRALLRGLIHSDGCRTVNRFTTRLPSGRVAEYAYPRYFFSNLSADIRAIFTAHCDLLGVRWTMSNGRNVSVAHRSSVALLDTFIGPKT